ncbi:hypothetical protein [Caloranaerobacter azorensis]|uniref:Uncharacterized protein n=1 Tax=Caloranaerobacter azorensis TaxID=116090 RepID=A0A6P1Y9U8_9FIRM|nr:hypothetical protein [Caloranaerobacter azorensis]QIB26120.1 hypothetical protein G3A45_01615 [Caloranaerobacter azorensis]
MINIILDFLKDNWIDIAVVLIFVFTLIYLWKKGKKQAVKDMIYYLVCKAEQEFGSKTGEIKYAAVVTWVYSMMPRILRFLFTKEEIGAYIEEAVEKLKQYLNSNSDINLLPYASEKLYQNK